MNELNLTPVEEKVLDFLISRNDGAVYWEELVQFAKDPQNASRKTALKWVSELKRKYALAGKILPFRVTFSSMLDSKPAPLQVAVAQPQAIGDLIKQQLTIKNGQQTLVKLQRPVPQVPQAHLDFVLNKFDRSVRTKLGIFKLNENEWNVFKYIHANVDKMITLSELRDEVVFPQYGSKLPARWFDSIMRIVNNLRRQITGLNGRLLTVKGPAETTYLFK